MLRALLFQRDTRVCVECLRSQFPSFLRAKNRTEIDRASRNEGKSVLFIKRNESNRTSLSEKCFNFLLPCSVPPRASSSRSSISSNSNLPRSRGLLPCAELFRETKRPRWCRFPLLPEPGHKLRSSSTERQTGLAGVPSGAPEMPSRDTESERRKLSEW